MITLENNIDIIVKPDYMPYTGTTGTTSINHNDTLNIQLAASGVTYGHIDNQSQTIYGQKTFENPPIVNESIILAPQAVSPNRVEGKVFYDYNKHSLSYYNEESDVTVNWNEILFRVYNGTAYTIPNGSVVCPDATTGIALADCRYKLKSRLVAVATHDIEAGTWGYVTKIGEVGGLDTSMYNAGDFLYLGNNGTLTTTRCMDGGYEVIMGIVDTVSATEGVITVDINISHLTVEVTDTNGFPVDQRTNTILAVDEGTRMFSIAPVVGTTFHYYQLGEKYEKTGTISAQFDDSEGYHWFYFEDETLTALYEPTATQKRDIILNHALVAYIYWNATDNVVVGDIWDERHGISMNPWTHLNLHLTRGCQLINGGFGVGDLLTNQNGSLATHAQFSIAIGTILDEDLFHTLESSINVGTAIPVLYLSGSESDPSLRESSQSTFAFLNAVSGRVYYNQNNAGTYQLTECANNSYVLYHIFAVNGQNDIIFSVPGQTNHLTLSAAVTAASTEISSIRKLLEFAEIVPIASILYQTRSTTITSAGATWTRSTTTFTITSTNHGLVTGDIITVTVSSNTGGLPLTTYAITVIDENSFRVTGNGNGQSSGTLTYTAAAFDNTIKTRIRKIGTLNYIDWRTTELAQGAPASSHNNLTNVEQAGLGVVNGHIGINDQDIYGIKNFKSGIKIADSEAITQIASGTTDNNIIITKGYFDDNQAGSTVTKGFVIAMATALG